jgi:NADH-ubiquinone oxidoreductase chain 6
MGFTILTLIQKNPIISILSLISVFFFSAIYLLQKLQLDYFAFVLLIIYIGAIAILFLFIVMMLNLKKVSQINVKK